MKMIQPIFTALMFVLIFLSGCPSGRQPDNGNGFSVPFVSAADLEAGFHNPPDYARTRAYWWWLEGYMTRQGVVDDLTAMKEAGICGAIVFDAGSSSYYTGRLTPHNAVVHTASGPGFITPEWCELFVYACHIADSRGTRKN